MESSEPVSPTPAKPGNRNVIIIVVAAIVLCCCCLVVGGGAYYWFLANPATTQSSTDFAPSTSQPSDSGLPEPQGNGTLPQGGRTDDLLRKDTWNYVGIAAQAQDCQAIALGTIIEVTQEPDSSGAWSEKWTVVCTDGNIKAFDVTFTPDPSGATNFSISTSK
jgi:hypothetical protein